LLHASIVPICTYLYLFVLFDLLLVKRGPCIVELVLVKIAMNEMYT